MRPAGWRSFLGTLGVAAIATVSDAQNPPNMLGVDCNSQEATLTMQANNQANYSCGNGSSTSTTTMVSDFQVNMSASALTLEIQGGPVLRTLNIMNENEVRLVNMTPSALNLTPLSAMYSLWFEGVAFDSLVLTLPNYMTDLHIVDSSLTNLELAYIPRNFSSIDLANTSFNRIPQFLYYQKYDEMNITIDLSQVNGITTLSAAQFHNLMFNVNEAYNASCKSETLSSGDFNVSCGSGSSSRGSASKNYTTPAEGSSSNSGSAEGAHAGDSSSSGLSTGALVAIIIVVIAIAGILAFFILRTYFRRRAANANSHNNEATATLMSKSDVTADKGSFISNDEFLRNFRLPQSDVALVKSVGTGRLWVGEYNGGKVMVKRVESEITDSYVTKALMAQSRTFATISHPNITSLVGVTWLAGTDFAVVTEFMDKGNLKTVLANTDVDLDAATKLQMCCDVALALAYLHETEQNLCAKQLSSRKVLVNKDMSCKLSLFECIPSSAKLGGPTTASTYSYGMGEVAWLPPEVITRSSPMDARKNNIYAFGVLVSEIFTRVSPYHSLVEEMGNTMSDVELVKCVRHQDPMAPHENRQEFVEAPVSVRQLVERCLSYAPMSRPTAKDLVHILHTAKEELATNSI